MFTNEGMKQVSQTSIDNFSLTISLRVKTVENLNFVSNYVSQGLPEITNELDIRIGHNGLRQTVQLDDAFEKILATLEVSGLRAK